MSGSVSASSITIQRRVLGLEWVLLQKSLTLSRIVWIPRSFSLVSQSTDSSLKGASLRIMSMKSSRKVVFPEPGGPVINVCGISWMESRIDWNMASCPKSLLLIWGLDIYLKMGVCA